MIYRVGVLSLDTTRPLKLDRGLCYGNVPSRNVQLEGKNEGTFVAININPLPILPWRRFIRNVGLGCRIIMLHVISASGDNKLRCAILER